MNKTLKKTLSIILAILMIATQAVPFAFAAYTVASGSCGADGDNLTWTLDTDGTLTISGTGAMAEYSSVNLPQYGDILPPWAGHKENIKKIVIEEGVTVLGLYAFYGHTAVKYVSIADTVTTFNGRVFDGCSAIESLLIPASVSILESTSFQDCSSLKKIVFLGKVDLDSFYAFDGCSELREIVFAKGATNNNAIGVPFTNEAINVSETVIHFGGTQAEAEAAFAPIKEWDKIYSVATIHYIDSCNCSVCGEYHIFDDGICDECNYLCPHSFTEFNETVAPKCEETGWEESYCDYCSIRLEQEVPETGHDWSKNILVRPTQNTDGSWTDGYYYDKCENDEAHNVVTGVAKRADYSGYDEAYKALKSAQGSEALTQEGAAAVNQAVTSGMMMPQNLVEGESSTAYLNNWVKNAQSIVAKLESGEYVKIDGVAYFNELALKFEAEIIEKYGDAFDEFSLTEEAQARWEEIVEKAEALTGSVAENKEALEEIKADLEAIFAEIEKCLNGTHSYGEGVLTRPIDEPEGYYTYTCEICGDEKTESVERANITLCEELLMQVFSYGKYDNLTHEAREEISQSYHSFIKNNSEIINDIGFIRIDLVADEQPIIDEAVAELQEIINEIEAKIASGEYVKADYTEIDEAIAEIEQKLASEDVTDEDKAGLEEIKQQLEALKADENASAADLAELFADLKEYEATLGTCPDCGRPVHEGQINEYICLLITLIKLVVSLVKTLGVIA